MRRHTKVKIINWPKYSGQTGTYIYTKDGLSTIKMDDGKTILIEEGHNMIEVKE